MRNALFLAFGLVFGISAYGQRFAIVDSEYILTKMPSYAQAQQQLDQLSSEWSGEVEALRSEVSAMRTAYEAEKVIMPEEKKKEKLVEIETKEQEARSLQRQYFGPEGEVFKKRLELMRPIQDQVYNAVQDIARKRNLDVVFDKSSDLITLYTSDKIDISEEVIEKLGY